MRSPDVDRDLLRPATVSRMAVVIHFRGFARARGEWFELAGARSMDSPKGGVGGVELKNGRLSRVGGRRVSGSRVRDAD